MEVVALPKTDPWDYIQAALEHAPPTHTLTDLQDGVARGDFQLWPGTHSAILTTVQLYPQRKVLCIYLAGGQMDELRAMLPGVLAWAKQLGCQSAFLAGRKGWTRTFLTRENGWRETDVILETTL